MRKLSRIIIVMLVLCCVQYKSAEDYEAKRFECEIGDSDTITVI